MNTGSRHAAILDQALRQAVLGAEATSLFTEDLTVWTPTFTAGSLAEMQASTSPYLDAFADPEMELHPLDVSGPYACTEWVLSMTHVQPLQIGNGRSVDRTGIRVSLMGVTVAEFRGERICAMRHYWDEMMLLEQLVSGRDLESGDS